METVMLQFTLEPVLKIGDSELQLSDLVTGDTYQKGTQITIVVQNPDQHQATKYF
jgi:PhnB protein